MKALKVYKILLFGLLLICPMIVEARLGWNLDQCKKEYGVLKKNDENMYCFETTGGRTVNILVDEKGFVQALEISPLSRDEAASFKNEFGTGWITTEKYPDYSIIPSPEWVKNKVGDIHGTEWNYYPKPKVMQMNTAAGQTYLAKLRAKVALNSPMKPEAYEKDEPKGVSSIRQVRKIYENAKL